MLMYASAALFHKKINLDEKQKFDEKIKNSDE
jgi:hypothetical protein